MCDDSVGQIQMYCLDVIIIQIEKLYIYIYIFFLLFYATLIMTHYCICLGGVGSKKTNDRFCTGNILTSGISGIFCICGQKNACPEPAADTDTVQAHGHWSLLSQMARITQLSPQWRLPNTQGMFKIMSCFQGAFHYDIYGCWPFFYIQILIMYIQL